MILDTVVCKNLYPELIYSSSIDAQLFKEAWLKAQKQNEILFAQAEAAAEAKAEEGKGAESESKTEEKKEEAAPAASS